MDPETIQRSRELAIHLNKDAYFPGETMSGLIYREAFINTRSAVVMVCIHGESKVLLESIGSAKKHYSCFVLARTCEKDPCILHRGPLRIWDGEGECWQFSFKIPFFADSTENEQNSSPSYTPVGATDHQVPPSYTLQKHGVATACVEYYVCAKLLYPRGIGEIRETEVVHAFHPFKLVHRSPNQPIDYSAVKRWRHPKTIRSTRLAPGTKSHWARRQLSRTSLLKFKFDLLFELPTTIQLDNPTPIPLRLAVDPDWEESDQSLRGFPQKVKLVSIELLLETHTRFILQRGEREFTTELNLDLAGAIRRLREMDIPCTSSWEPADIGELIDLRLGLINEPGFPKPSWATEITPSFRTYNMTVTHKLAWKIHVKIAREAFIVGGKADVLILRSSDGRRLPSSSGQNPSVPAGTGTETEAQASETGPGGSALWDQEDDSWIVPPPEDEAPPSFADACVMR